MMDFEKFTNQAKQMMAGAQQVIQRYSHTQLDVEHILLALLEQEDGVVPRIIEKLGVDKAVLVQNIERELAKRPQVSGSGAEGQIYITPHTQRIFDLAWTVAQRFSDTSFITNGVRLTNTQIGR